MKIFKYFCLLCLVGLLALPDVYAGDYTRFNSVEVKRTRDDDQQDRDSFRIKDRTGVSVYFKITEDGSMHLYNADGSPNFYNPTYKVVVLDDFADFSTWAGNSVSDAESGSSYYQTVAGKIYVVDPIAIMNSTTGKLADISARAGVTLHLPLATATNDYQTVEVMWAQRNSGTSATPVAFTVYVFPAPLAGTTSYTGTGAITAHQNMSGMATSGSSTITTSSTAGSYNINSVGESGVWMLMNDSAVSAIYKREGGIFP